jgi:hypothetical protein
LSRYQSSVRDKGACLIYDRQAEENLSSALLLCHETPKRYDLVWARAVGLHPVGEGCQNRVGQLECGHSILARRPGQIGGLAPNALELAAAILPGPEQVVANHNHAKDRNECDRCPVQPSLMVQGTAAARIET